MANIKESKNLLFPGNLSKTLCNLAPSCLSCNFQLSKAAIVTGPSTLKAVASTTKHQNKPLLLFFFILIIFF